MKTYTLEDIRKAFEAGFKNGQTEQLNRDFPDVGMSFETDVSEYWKEYKKKLS